MKVIGHPENNKLWVVIAEWYGEIRIVFSGDVFECAKFYHENK